MNRNAAKTTPNPTRIDQMEMASCGPHADFIPQGACSDQNTPKENKAIRKGEKPGNIKKRKMKSESFAEFLASRESGQRGKNG